ITDALGNTVASFTYSNAGAPFAIYLPGVGGFYYHYDAFGSVNRLTSATGATAASYQYDAYGNLVSSIHGSAWNAALSHNPFMFMGGIEAISDPELGLVTANGIPYSPALGNPLSPPVSLAPRTRMAACNGN